MLAEFQGISQSLISASAALIGVIVGALLTWKLQQLEVKRCIHEERISKLRHAMVGATTQYNSIANLWIQFLGEHESDPDRHNKIMSIGDYASHTLIEVESLSFLVDIGEPNLLMELEVHNREYEQAVGIVKYRNWCMEEMRKVAKMGPLDANGGMEMTVPVEQDYRLKMVSDNLYEIAESSMQSSRKVIGKLQEALNRFDGKAKPIAANLPDYRQLLNEKCKEKTQD